MAVYDPAAIQQQVGAVITHDYFHADPFRLGRTPPPAGLAADVMAVLGPHVDGLLAEVERLRRQVESQTAVAMRADDYACGPNCCVYDLASGVLAASHTEADDA